jgi:hypothetical protein
MHNQKKSPLLKRGARGDLVRIPFLTGYKHFGGILTEVARDKSVVS